ncbi:MAG: hypothetical protein OXF67_02575 [Cyanobacteria bacterium MAG CAR4_bin_6]|nr:hypothetical protein [Cyanobacteria bacterium MAG CAR4_bin_6]MCY4235938.1 hypothetical protein [Cyanobacteria bacterium MAG CAR2_bin_4]
MASRNCTRVDLETRIKAASRKARHGFEVIGKDAQTAARQLQRYLEQIPVSRFLAFIAALMVFSVPLPASARTMEDLPRDSNPVLSRLVCDKIEFLKPTMSLWVETEDGGTLYMTEKDYGYLDEEERRDANVIVQRCNGYIPDPSVGSVYNFSGELFQ